jgi:hypothetical protein
VKDASTARRPDVAAEPMPNVEMVGSYLDMYNTLLRKLAA